jgi:hypothetical protein
MHSDIDAWAGVAIKEKYEAISKKLIKVRTAHRRKLDGLEILNFFITEFY